MLVNVDTYCDIRYGLRGSPPTKAQRNTVSAMCRNGTLEASKSGKRWIIKIGGEDGDGEKHADAPEG